MSDTPIFMQMLTERGTTGGLSKWAGELRNQWSTATTAAPDAVAISDVPTKAVQQIAEATPLGLSIPQDGSTIQWQRVAPTPEAAQPAQQTPPTADRRPLGNPSMTTAGLVAQTSQDAVPAGAAVAPPQAQQYSMPYGNAAATPPYTGQPEVLQQTQPMPQVQAWAPAPHSSDPQTSGNTWGHGGTGS